MSFRYLNFWGILLSFISCSYLFAGNSERYYQEKLAKKLLAKQEVVMSDGTRCDLVTETHAIEVDFARKWAEAIGQSLNYGRMTGKTAGIVLIIEKDGDSRHVVRIKNIIRTFKLPLDLFVVRMDASFSKS
ncbi:MAG: hypothetical protein P8P49_12630 [Opitutales bacterium]|nr:hypothetical protein [Opitutales bacterium]